MDVETKLDLITDFAEEIVIEDELRELFETKEHPVAYDGFEPSGVAPIHFGLLRAANLKNMLKAGVKFKLYLADYFAYINNKLGGELENIRKAGKYFIEVWKACGIDTKKVDIVWAKDLMDGIDYWDRMLTVAKNTTINRSMKSVTVMGRKKGEKLSTGQLMYPSMQVTDIFELGVDICQLGMDQRRANMLARDIASKMDWNKPVAVHHHMLLGLQGVKKGKTSEETMIASKMSKSNPKSAIYMHDSFKEIKEKLNGAFCPPKQVEGNPILDYCRHIIFKEKDSLKIERKEKYGGDLEIYSSDELDKIYRSGDLHPMDLKKAVGVALNDLIEPCRKYFKENKKAAELYEVVKHLKITR